MKGTMISWAFLLLLAGTCPLDLRVALGSGFSEVEIGDPAGMLPGDAEASGWKPSSDPEFYVPGNLWNYMNGQAAMYVDYGFRRLARADYKRLDGPGVVGVEIFRMQGPEHAFGIYAAERSSEGEFVSVGVEGYLWEEGLNFWKGPYYVRLLCYETWPGFKEKLSELGRLIANKVKGEYAEPGMLAFLPRDGRVKRSERFIPKDLLGQPFLKNGYRADYELNGDRYQVFLVRHPSRQDAEEAFGKYQQHLASMGKQVSASSKAGYRAVLVRGKRGEIHFHSGLFTGGILDVGDLSHAWKVMEQMIEKLKR